MVMANRNMQDYEYMLEIGSGKDNICNRE